MKIQMKTYCYCNICGKPVKEDNSDNDYNFCLNCALDLYQKIFGETPRNHNKKSDTV